MTLLFRTSLSSGRLLMRSRSARTSSSSITCVSDEPSSSMETFCNGTTTQNWTCLLRRHYCCIGLSVKRNIRYASKVYLSLPQCSHIIAAEGCTPVTLIRYAGNIRPVEYCPGFWIILQSNSTVSKRGMSLFFCSRSQSTHAIRGNRRSKSVSWTVIASRWRTKVSGK